MKGKPTWKPAGLRAKRWREASQTRGFTNFLPERQAARVTARRKKAALKPYEQEAP
jgi:hypothetical protein